jgi:hypothetical protein
MEDKAGKEGRQIEEQGGHMRGKQRDAQAKASKARGCKRCAASVINGMAR